MNHRRPENVAERRLWCERALVGDGVSAGVLLTVDGDSIAAVEGGVASPPPDSVRIEGLTLPGFANAHSHAFHRALRGRTHGDGGTFWTWRERMYELAARLDPDTYEQLATAAFAEMVLAGYTAVGEFHYLHHGTDGVPYADPNEIGRRLVSAAEAAGIRLALLDTCYLRAGVGGGELSPVQRRFSDGDAVAWAERVEALHDVESATVRVGAAFHSVRAVDPGSIVGVSDWARAHAAPLHAHVSEQPQENADSLAEHGCTPVELLHRHGVLDDRFTAVHATHLTERDTARLGSARGACCICPTTERDLADGVGPAAALAAAGASLCIGSDSHAVIDPFEETRAVELDERLSSGRRGTHSPAVLLAAATAGGYVSLGWPTGGAIAAGRLADLVTVGLDSPRLAGAGDDLAAAVVFAASAADVRHVIVGGRDVVRDAAHLDVDVSAALTESVAAAWGTA